MITHLAFSVSGLDSPELNKRAVARRGSMLQGHAVSSLTERCKTVQEAEPGVERCTQLKVIPVCSGSESSLLNFLVHGSMAKHFHDACRFNPRMCFSGRDTAQMAAFKEENQHAREGLPHGQT